MDKDVYLLIIGGIIGFISSILTTIITFILERNKQKSLWEHELQIQKLRTEDEKIKEAQRFIEEENKKKYDKEIRGGITLGFEENTTNSIKLLFRILDSSKEHNVEVPNNVNFKRLLPVILHKLNYDQLEIPISDMQVLNHSKGDVILSNELMLKELNLHEDDLLLVKKKD